MPQIVAHPRHAARAKRLDAYGFDSIEHRACNDRLRRGTVMGGRVMMPQAQGKSIGKAAGFGHLRRGQRATWHRHFQVLARLRRRVGGIGQLDLGLMRNSAGGAGQHSAKGFERSLFGHPRIA